MPLYNIDQKSKYVIEQIPQVGLLKSLGLREGATVTVLSQQPLGGPIVIKIGSRHIAIAKDLADQITVKETS
ncbi:ferrous iron transport protein A [Heliorestis acidaminivorans]|uniref:Ferrous iron transport protein A n=1 Tax=Heliorestis acidaminivorans TaxID=553427 RepID=A0A6I0EQV4_9FIRM|nr:FeoA family protein [Heliorestis acidaminivorans]KAB2951807.1 ferrous iron transport protein A [Heliorestis acidaminivorans]